MDINCALPRDSEAGGMRPGARSSARRDRKRGSESAPTIRRMYGLHRRWLAAASPLAPRDDTRGRAGANPYRMVVIAADREDGSMAQDLDHLEDMMRHHPDDAGRRTARRSAPMRPIAREIVFGSGITPDQTTHLPPAPCGRASIGGASR